MDSSDIYNLYLKSKGVSTDTRNIETGSIFFALKGSNFNGNEFALEAIEKGASHAIIDEEKYNLSKKCILVENSLQVLQEIAKIHRNKLSIPIIGITGSNGKTTTKELISAVLSQKYNVLYTQGNYNNHIGVPLTILKLSDIHQIGVIEMGANHIGEIEKLSNICMPNFGVITNIGKAHIEGFGSFDGVKKAKTELYRNLKANKGKIIFNSENEILVEQISKLDYENAISYKSIINDKIEKFINENGFINIKVGKKTIKSNLFGEYNFENILASICFGIEFKVDLDLITKAIEKYYPGNNRSQLLKSHYNKLVLDLYNANPTSMRAAINSFTNTFTSNKVFILGDMLETGTEEKDSHLEIIDLVKQKENKVYLVGKTFKKIASVDDNILSFENVSELSNYIKINKITEKNILIKGSRGIQLEKIVPLL